MYQNKASHIYIHEAYTDSFSVSNKQPPGVSLWLCCHVIPFCLSQLFLSVSAVNYQIKVKLQKAAACDSGAHAHIFRRQQIPLAVIIFVSKISMPLCVSMDDQFCSLRDALRISAPVVMDTHDTDNDLNIQLWYIFFSL